MERETGTLGCNRKNRASPRVSAFVWPVVAVEPEIPPVDVSPSLAAFRRGFAALQPGETVGPFPLCGACGHLAARCECPGTLRT